jgi:hypothetical protein
MARKVKKQAVRRHKQEKAHVASGQGHEVAYEAKKTRRSIKKR